MYHFTGKLRIYLEVLSNADIMLAIKDTK